MKTKNIIVTGPLPPPIGGVTIFLKYFYEAAKYSEHANLSPLSCSRLISRRYKYIHINASNNIKRFLLIVLGKLFLKKVFFVKHGGPFDLSSIFVRASLQLADGVFCLNKQVKSQLDLLNKRCMQHSTVFSENGKDLINSYPSKELSDAASAPVKLLLYINNDLKLNGEEIYGGSFFLGCLPSLKGDFEVTVVDLSGKFKDDFYGHLNVTYLEYTPDFKALLSTMDIYIRPTSSDGMSVAILEAGLLNVKCLASDVVERPSFVHVYKYGDKKDFVESLHKLVAHKSGDTDGFLLSSVEDVFDFMTAEN